MSNPNAPGSTEPRLRRSSLSREPAFQQQAFTALTMNVTYPANPYYAPGYFYDYGSYANPFPQQPRGFPDFQKKGYTKGYNYRAATPKGLPVPGKVSIKTGTGQEVDLGKLAKDEKPKAPEEKPKVVNDFMLKVRAAAAKKKEEAEKKKAEEEKAKAEAAAKVKAEAEAKAKAEAEAKAKAEAEAKAKAEAEAKAKQEEQDNAIAAANEAEAVKKAEEEPSPEQKAVTTEDQPQEPEPLHQEKFREVKRLEERNLAEALGKPAVEPEEIPSAGFSLLELQAALEKAQPITNPFSFSYPEGFHAPDDKCKAIFEKTGKIKYDPMFLMQFQSPMRLEVDAEWREKHSSKIIVDVGGSNRSGSNRLSSFRNASGFGMGLNIGSARAGMGSLRSQPRKGFSEKGSLRQGSKRKGGLNSGLRREGGRLDLKRGGSKRFDESAAPSEPAEPVKPLEKTATRWVPKTLKKKDEPKETKKNPDGTDFLDQEDVERTAKLLLNKLTLEMFDSITDEIMDVAKQSRWEEDAKTLKLVLALTFHKACDEPHWLSMYAQFCAKMVKTYPPDIKDLTMHGTDDQPLAGGVLVRKCLLQQCQTEFEKGWSGKLPTKDDGSALDPEMMSDEYYAAAAAKRRGLGLVRFIGELYALGLLSAKVIRKCIVLSLQNAQDRSEESLETLAQLIATVGPIFDAGLREQGPWVQDMMSTIFREVTAILKDPAVLMRIKFKFLDLLDLRKAGWKSANKGPQTIAEIHAEAEKAREEEKRKGGDKKSKRYESRDHERSTWGQKTLLRTDMKGIGMVRGGSERLMGPTNNFGRHQSRENLNREKVNQFDVLGDD